MLFPNRTKIWIAVLILFGGLPPLLWYWLAPGRVPTVRARVAIQMLNQPNDHVVLVDVRDVDAFASQHVTGAQHWPLKEIAALNSPTQVPAQFRAKTLLLVCSSGFLSAKATRKLQTLGITDVYNVHGGLQEWAKAGQMYSGMKFSQFASNGKPDYFAFQPMTVFEQRVAVLSGFVIKPLYMILSVILVLALRRIKSSDLVALRWGLIFFFIGEAFCAINYLFFHDDAYLSEYFHSYGMVLSFAFAAFAVMEGLDTRLIKFSAPNKRCAAFELCGSCVKYSDVQCGVRKVIQLIIPAMVILTLIPLLATINPVSYNSDIFGTLYNYARPVIYQIFEIRYCPLLAIVLFSFTFVTLPNLSFLLGKEKKSLHPVPFISRMLFSAGLGAWGFSMFRLLFGVVYQNNLVWSTFWEELTELIFVVSVAIILWLFRHNLFQKNHERRERTRNSRKVHNLANSLNQNKVFPEERR